MSVPSQSRRYPYPLITLVAVSGAGKTTLGARLVSEMGLARIVSCTTRSRREDEAEGAYIFLTEAEFREGIAARAFAEWAEPFEGTLYGRRWKELDVLQREIAFADMTEHGICTLRAAGVWLVCVRIEPRHQEVLVRVTDRTNADAKRAQIPVEIDATVINDHGQADGLDRAYADLVKVIQRYPS